MSELKCSKYVIAYIDILGTKEELRHNSSEFVQKMSSIVKGTNMALSINNSNYEKMNDIKFKIFSDNVVLTIPYRDEEDIIYLLGFVAMFYQQLIDISGWLARGAITIGDLFIDDDFVIGEGLVRAYELESKVAIYPRVIMDPVYYNNILKALGDINLMFDKDIDGLYYMNIIRYIFDKSVQIKLLNDIESICTTNAPSDDRIIQKINWMLKFVENMRRELGNK